MKTESNRAPFLFCLFFEFKQIFSSSNRQATEGCSDKSFDGFRKKMCVARHTSQTFLRVALATVVLIIGGLWFKSKKGSHKMKTES